MYISLFVSLLTQKVNLILVLGVAILMSTGRTKKVNLTLSVVLRTRASSLSQSLTKIPSGIKFILRRGAMIKYNRLNGA